MRSFSIIYSLNALVTKSQNYTYYNLANTLRYALVRFCSNENKKTQDKKNPGTDNPSDELTSESKTTDDVPLEAPDEPTTCCMSGCANCVWLEYADKLNHYYKDGGDKSIKEINEKITDPNIKAYLLHEIRMRQK